MEFNIFTQEKASLTSKFDENERNKTILIFVINWQP